MSTTHQLSSHRPANQQDLRDLVDEIVYARALIAVNGGEGREHDRPLRVALDRALAQLASTAAEQQRIAHEALQAAWSRIAGQLGIEPELDSDGSVASAA